MTTPSAEPLSLSPPRSGARAWFAPALFTCAFLAVVGASAWFSHLQSARRQHDALAAAAQHASAGIRFRLQGTERLLRALADAHARGALDAAAFRQRAGAYLEAHPEILVIARTDASLVIADIAPLDGFQDRIGRPLKLPQPDGSPGPSTDRPGPFVSGTFLPTVGGPAFVVFVPAPNGPADRGFMAAAITWKELLAVAVAPPVASRHLVEVVTGSDGAIGATAGTDPGGPMTSAEVPIGSPWPAATVRLTARRDHVSWGTLVLLTLASSLAVGMGYALWRLKSDVAAHRRAEQSAIEGRRAAERSRAILEAIIEGTSDAVFVKDTEGRYQLLNTAGCRMVGKPPEEVLGRDDTALFSPDGAALVMANDRRVMRADGPDTSTETLDIDGRTVTFWPPRAPSAIRRAA
jgi:PAS domain S-box-containing protein